MKICLLTIVWVTSLHRFHVLNTHNFECRSLFRLESIKLANCFDHVNFLPTLQLCLIISVVFYGLKCFVVINIGL